MLIGTAPSLLLLAAATASRRCCRLLLLLLLLLPVGCRIGLAMLCEGGAG